MSENPNLEKLASGGLLGIGIANANSVFWAGGYVYSSEILIAIRYDL